MTIRDHPDFTPTFETGVVGVDKGRATQSGAGNTRNSFEAVGASERFRLYAYRISVSATMDAAAAAASNVLVRGGLTRSGIANGGMLDEIDLILTGDSGSHAYLADGTGWVVLPGAGAVFETGADPEVELDLTEIAGTSPQRFRAAAVVAVVGVVEAV